MKKTLSLVIALIFMFAFCTTAFAEDPADPETTIVETLPDEETLPVEETLPDEETFIDETDPDETTPEETFVLGETYVDDATDTDNTEEYDVNIAENVMYKGGDNPATGTATAGIAVFAALSIAAAAAFVCVKKKA